jgi:hypothetical protein
MTEMKLIVYILKEAITGFVKALCLRNQMYSPWGRGVQERILECFETGFRLIGMQVPTASTERTDQTQN